MAGPGTAKAKAAVDWWSGWGRAPLCVLSGPPYMVSLHGLVWDSFGEVELKVSKPSIPGGKAGSYHLYDLTSEITLSLLLYCIG